MSVWSATDITSPYYPYEKVETGFTRMERAADIPLLICRYLLDLPLPGYTPPDNNDFPRCRLMKRLWYDGVNPLGFPVPTTQEKLSMLYDGSRSAVNTDEEKAAHPKGYRLYPMQYVQPTQIDAETNIKIFMGQEIPTDDFRVEISIYFDIYCNANLEGEMGVGGLSKAYAMEKDVIAALHGVNLAGIGVIHYSRMSHREAGSHPYYDESGTNVGRRLTMSLGFADGGGGTTEEAYW